MYDDRFYVGEFESIQLEHSIASCDSFEDFEKRFSDEFLQDDKRVARYLSQLLDAYEKKASVVSVDAMQNQS